MGRNERDFCPFLFPSAIYGAYPSSSPSSTASPPSSPPSSSSYSHSSSSSLSITSPFLSPSTADGYLNRQCSEQEITMEFKPAPRSNSTVSKRRPAMTKIAIPLEFGESNSSINSNNYSNCLNPDKSWKLQAYSSLMIFCVLLWLIWHNRNCILFNEDQLLDWAIGYVEEFQTAALKRKGTGQGVRQEEEDNRWVPPRNGLFKVNVDKRS